MGCSASLPGVADAIRRCAASTARSGALSPDRLASRAATASGLRAAPNADLVSQRAAERNLPERLTLGLSVDAIERYIAGLPADVVEQCNENRPTINGVRVPANAALNGYVNQWQIARRSEADGGKAYCEALYERSDPGVGVATVFVSWFLETPLATLVDALRQLWVEPQVLPPDTKFWDCDIVIRQSTRQLDVTMNDVKRLGDCVRAVGHTVLLMEPWYDPSPLRRAYCIKEVFHTQASGARFEVVMSAEQQAAFETALMKDFNSIKAKLSQVDVRKAECRNPRDTEQILGELEREVGLTECNKAVFGLLRAALAGQGSAALERMEPAERATSNLINNLGLLLKDQGDLDGAEALLREALEARRETLGDRHPNTLISINNLGLLLKKQGDLDGAEPLLREALEAQRETLGDRHPDTLSSISNLGGLLA